MWSDSNTIVVVTTAPIIADVVMTVATHSNDDLHQVPNKHKVGQNKFELQSMTTMHVYR